jgi:hypothetical protein
MYLKIKIDLKDGHLFVMWYGVLNFKIRGNQYIELEEILVYLKKLKHFNEC